MEQKPDAVHYTALFGASTTEIQQGSEARKRRAGEGSRLRASDSEPTVRGGARWEQTQSVGMVPAFQ